MPSPTSDHSRCGWSADRLPHTAHGSCPGFRPEMAVGLQRLMDHQATRKQARPAAPGTETTHPPAVADDAWKTCYTCRDYAGHRRAALAEPLADKARREGRDVVSVVDEFMWAAHARHLNGEPLRPDGPTRVTDPTIGRLAALLSPGLFGTTTETP